MSETSTGSAAPVADPDDFPATLSRRRLRTVVAELAADRYTGRRIGTPGGRAATAWLAAHLRSLGARITEDSVAATPVKESSATPTLTWSPAGAATTIGTHRRDFAEHLATADVPNGATGLASIDLADTAGRWLLAAAYTADVAIAAPPRAAMPSDNRRYAAAGLPSVGVGMGMPGYQTPAETVERVETDTIVAATWLTVAAVRTLIHIINR